MCSRGKMRSSEYYLHRKRRRSAVLSPACFVVVSSLFVSFPSATVTAQQQDPQTLNGGSVLAMAGKGCVAVAVDKRFGSGPQTVNISPRHVLAPNPSLLVAFTGLDGDVRSLSEELSVQISAKVGRESGFGFEDSESIGGDVENGGNALPLPVPVSSSSRRISPRSMAALTSHVLYSRRKSPYYVEPIVAGLERGCPFLCSHDLIGAQSKSDSFVCSGAASKSLYGTAQAFWHPNMQPDELARVCGRAFLSALERDCLSGYGAIVYLIVANDTEDKGGGCRIIEYDLACRND